MTEKDKKKMIFYDNYHKRKKAFRYALVAFVVSITALSGNLAVSIATTSTNDIEFNRDFYYSDDNENRLALTFDDGPSRRNTRKILEILKANEVPATFFFLGENIIKHQDIVKETAEAGMEIGNHSFTHSHDVHSSPRRIRYELNLTNELIKDLTGKPAVLYRPPYLLDIGADPFYMEEDNIEHLNWIRDEGYFAVGADIDPKDWDSRSPREVEINLENRIENGKIILLHDGGHDIRYTVDSLDSIIKDYKDQGYQFVTVSNILGIDGDNNKKESDSGILFTIRDYLKRLYLEGISYIALTMINYIVFFLVFFAGLRLLFISLLFLYNKIKNKWPKQKKEIDLPSSKLPSFSVVIPAYNEEASIEATIESVVNNKMPYDEIIVVNDGSSDKTREIVTNLKSRIPNINLINLENGGKARALNHAYHISKSEVLICMDGDTIFHKDAIQNLIKHFADEEVSAVAGKVSAIIKNNYLGGFQQIEYIIGQNIEKTAFSSINSVGVVPGPIGAWRREDVIKLGGYSVDTLVEDQDLTLAILSKGKKIAYEPNAICYTETPATVKDFGKQRFRWIYGTMQCFWKYKKFFLNLKRKNLGFVVLPNIALYNTLVPLFSPILDFLALVAILSGSWEHALIAYNIFTAFDIAYASLAFLRGEKKNLHLLMLIPLQRIFYRQILYYIVFKSLIRAIEGTSALWNKVERNGNLQKFYLRSLGHGQ